MDQGVILGTSLIRLVIVITAPLLAIAATTILIMVRESFLVSLFIGVTSI